MSPLDALRQPDQQAYDTKPLNHIGNFLHKPEDLNQTNTLLNEINSPNLTIPTDKPVVDLLMPDVTKTYSNFVRILIHPSVVQPFNQLDQLTNPHPSSTQQVERINRGTGKIPFVSELLQKTEEGACSNPTGIDLLPGIGFGICLPTNNDIKTTKRDLLKKGYFIYNGKTNYEALNQTFIDNSKVSALLSIGMNHGAQGRINCKLEMKDDKQHPDYKMVTVKGPDPDRKKHVPYLHLKFSSDGKQITQLHAWPGNATMVWESDGQTHSQTTSSFNREGLNSDEIVNLKPGDILWLKEFPHSKFAVSNFHDNSGHTYLAIMAL